MQRAGSWLLAVICFFGFYAYFSAPPNSEPPPFFTPWTVAGLVACFLVFFAFFYWRLSRGLKPTIEGNRALMRGDFKTAVELATEGVRLSPGIATTHYVLAQTLAYSMQPQEAKAAFARAANASGAKRISGSYAAHEELIAALLGEPQRSAEVQGPEVTLAQAVRACRAERWAEAKELLRTDGMKMLWATNLELRELLLAWSEERLGSPPRKVDVSLLTREGVADASSWWPELGERVEASRA